jgi:hypothetical protein
MTDNGDAAKQIWMTEWGAPTNGPSGSGYVSEAVQADMIRDAFQLVKTYPWAGPLFVYRYNDLGTSNSTIENFFGLVRFDNSKKPAWNAYQQYSK